MNHGWEKKRLGEICKIKTGKLDANAKVENGLYPFFTCDARPYRINEYAFDDDAILISGNGSNVGHVHYYNGKFNAYQRTYVLTDFSLFVTSYLVAYMKGFLRPYIFGCKKGGCIPFITLPILSNFLIPCPSVEKQNQIVGELDKLNELIDLKRNQLKDLDALAQSLFYETFGDPIENPKGFPIKTLKDVCILKSGDSSANRLPKGIIPYVKVGDMNLIENKQGIITSTNFVNIENKTKLLFPVGTTIFPKRGGAILTNKKKLTKVQICCDLNIMGAIPIKIHPIYLYFFFLEKDFSELVDGSTVPQINNTDIYPLKILVPPLSLQEKFATNIEAIEEQKRLIESSIADLETLLASRMDYWFND